MTEITPRCPGSYHGSNLHHACLDCQRLLTGYPAGHWYIKVPVFEYECLQQLKKETE